MVKEYRIQVPEYVTPSMLDRIKKMMAKGRIHPTHQLCDMTAEIAAGAPMKEALEQMVRRTVLKETDSIYQKLFTINYLPKNIREADIKRRDYEKAIAALTKAIKRHPRSADLYNQRSIAYHKIGEKEKAIDDACMAFELQ
ncbi:MAG: tetratricopeptide repeat protein [Nanoarchaeota archaeon]|nr:tetratricopeptide repeat protein [Nanoarchaeota archaeon]